VIKALKKLGFQELTVIKNYVKDIHQQSYANVALLVKEITP
jgi:hypothetical protein